MIIESSMVEKHMANSVATPQGLKENGLLETTRYHTYPIDDQRVVTRLHLDGGGYRSEGRSGESEERHFTRVLYREHLEEELKRSWSE